MMRGAGDRLIVASLGLRLLESKPAGTTAWE